MSIPTVLAHDVIGANVHNAPPGQLAGYTTGSGAVPWTAAQFDAHPGTVRIDQSRTSSIWDSRADVDDYENGAVLLSELAGRAKERMASFHNVDRPGQREPAVYMSQSNVTAVVNALIAGGVVSRVGLWIANWNMTQAEAEAAVANASGPFPIIGIQYNDTGSGPSDTDIFSKNWLGTVSHAAPSGPVRRVIQAGNKMSFSGLADSRNMKEDSFLTEQEGFVHSGHLSPLHYNTLYAMKIAGDANAASGWARPALEPGTVYYTNG